MASVLHPSVVMWKRFIVIPSETKWLLPLTILQSIRDQFGLSAPRHGLTAKVRAHGSSPWAWVLFSFGQLALHFLLTLFGVKKCLENHVAVHVQHISRRCVRQGTKPLMHINMTHWPVWPTNKKSFLPFLSLYATPTIAQSSMIFWKRYKETVFCMADWQCHCIGHFDYHITLHVFRVAVSISIFLRGHWFHL